MAIMFHINSYRLKSLILGQALFFKCISSWNPPTTLLSLALLLSHLVGGKTKALMSQA